MEPPSIRLWEPALPTSMALPPRSGKQQHERRVNNERRVSKLRKRKEKVEKTDQVQMLPSSGAPHVSTDWQQRSQQTQPLPTAPSMLPPSEPRDDQVSLPNSVTPGASAGQEAEIEQVQFLNNGTPDPAIPWRWHDEKPGHVPILHIFTPDQFDYRKQGAEGMVPNDTITSPPHQWKQETGHTMIPNPAVPGQPDQWQQGVEQGLFSVPLPITSCPPSQGDTESLLRPPRGPPDVIIPIVPTWPLPPQAECLQSSGLSLLPGRGYLVYAPGCPTILVPFSSMEPMQHMQPDIPPAPERGAFYWQYRFPTPMSEPQDWQDPIKLEFTRKLFSLPDSTQQKITQMILSCQTKH